MCVTLTPAAATFIKRMVRFGGGSADSGFRLAVKPGGCFGFSYDFTIEAAPSQSDAVIEQAGVRLFLPAESCELLRGHTVDFVETRMDSKLTFIKPGAPQVCGCGAGEPKSAAPVVIMRRGASCAKT